MKKNTLSLLETIKRKIKKIDDSDDSSSLEGVDQEFEYLDGDQKAADKAKKGQDAQGKAIDENPSDDGNVEDLQLEADIENSTSDSLSAAEISADEEPIEEESDDLADEKDPVATDLEADEEDDFDLSFENSDEENDLEEQEDSKMSDDEGELPGIDDFDDGEELKLDEVDLPQENELPQIDELAQEENLADLDINFEEEQPESLEDELFADSAGENVTENIESEAIAEDLPNEDVIHDKKGELDILDESYFASDSQAKQEEIPEEESVPVDEHPQIDEQVQGENRRGSGFSAKSFTEILAEEKLAQEQSQSQSQEQSPESELHIEENHLEETPLEENHSEEGPAENQAEDSLDLGVDEDFLDSKPEENPVDPQPEENSLNVDEIESQKQKQDQEIENLIQGENDPLNDLSDLDLDNDPKVNVADDQKGDFDFDRELSLDSVSTSAPSLTEVVQSEEALSSESNDAPNDEELNVAQESSHQQSDDDFIKELELQESNTAENPTPVKQYTSKDLDDDLMLNSDLASKVSNSIKELQDAKSMVGQVENFAKGDILSHVAFELMKPKLEQWLNDNLPGLVENVVREEIEKIISGSNK